MQRFQAVFAVAAMQGLGDCNIRATGNSKKPGSTDCRADGLYANLDIEATEIVVRRASMR